MQSIKKEMASKKIFISHSSMNEEFATWLTELLDCLGVNRNTIFYSSDFTRGVNTKISESVFQALRNTVVDIIILSNEYKESEYCLNEAGIICFKNGKSDRIVIALPDVTGNIGAGFVNEDYIQHRLSDSNFLDSLINKLHAILGKHGLIQSDRPFIASSLHKFSKELEEYKKRIPVFENLSIPYVDEWHFDSELEEIKLARKHIQEIYQQNKGLLPAQNHVFYKDYDREIRILAAENDGEIQVRTATVCIVVNLSDTDYTETFSSKFLKENGGYNSYNRKAFKVNGIDVNALDEKEDYMPSLDSPYIVTQSPKIIVPAHSSTRIEFVTIYNIKVESFFQSKVLYKPCGNYSFQANFDVSFFEKFGKDYIFRSQIIPHIRGSRRDRTFEDASKKSIHYSVNAGFPANGGYVLSISKQ